MHLHSIPPHKVQKSPPLNVQSYNIFSAETVQKSTEIAHFLDKAILLLSAEMQPQGFVIR
jgi:hypothetical protein